MQISPFILGIAVVAAGGVGLLVGFLIRKRLGEAKLESAEKLAERTVAEAEKKAEMLKKEALLQAKDNLYQTKAEFDKEMADKRGEIQRLERRLLQREANTDKKVDILDAKEIDLNKRERASAFCPGTCTKRSRRT